MPVLKVFTGTINPGQVQFWNAWVGYPNANPDLFLEWLVRPVYPPGHAGHPGHQMKLVSMDVLRDPGNQSGFLYLLQIQSTGSHFTEFEMLANYTSI
jgi:hypothetical protein